MRSWTLEADRMLVSLWETDKSASEIAIALGRTAGAIQQRARRLGLGGRKQTIKSRTSADGKNTWTPEEDARIGELRRSGHKTSMIAVILGRSYNAVKSREAKILDNSRVSTDGRKFRTCLGTGCGTTFLSDGPGNRLCEPCRRYAAYACGQYD